MPLGTNTNLRLERQSWADADARSWMGASPIPTAARGESPLPDCYS
jgi:hypothetical protein